MITLIKMSTIKLCNDCFDEELKEYEGMMPYSFRKKVKSFMPIQDVEYVRCEDYECPACAIKAEEKYLYKVTYYEDGEQLV